MNVQTNVLIKEERILKNKIKLYPFNKVSYNSCLKTFRSHVKYETFRDNETFAKKGYGFAHVLVIISDIILSAVF
jgi:hypothetical protein